MPAWVDAWARTILAMPVAEVCAGETHAGYFCQVRESLVTSEVRGIGARSITLQAVRSNERYLDFDFGGGHVEAHGVLIGPAGWTHVANTERGERKLRDGVFAYDTRQ
ncbi:MAG TPA: hypothetical protein VIV11_29965 [Kofleriaceae bacterium]